MLSTIFTVGIAIAAYLYISKKIKEHDDDYLHFLNLAIMMYDIQGYIHEKVPEKERLKYGFMLQYLEDIQNYNVKELNRRWYFIFDMLTARTRAKIEISYTPNKRIHPRTIIDLSKLFGMNNYNLREGIHTTPKDLKDTLKSELPDYPITVEELSELALEYDANYLGDVLSK